MDSPEKTSETKSNPEAEKVPDPPKKLGLQRRGVQSAKSIKQSVQSSSQVSVPYQRPSSANLGLYRDMLNHGCGNGDIDWMNALRSQSRGSSVTTFKR
jgi:pyrimidine operon attenuation protein/uracil phosphoribosyltransferase